MKLSLSKIVVIFAFILTTTACAQEQGLIYNFFGGGARSEGMGQAFLAISNDGTAGSWNPAGLYVHEKTLMSFSYDFFMPRGNYTYSVSPGLSKTFAHEGSYGALNYWSIVSPLRVKNHHFVMNLSYTKNFDTYFKFGERLVDRSTESPNALYTKHGRISNICLALGTRLYEQVSFGLAFNVYMGTVVANESRTLLHDTTLQFGTYPYTSNIQLIDSTSYSGFSTILGLMYSSQSIRGGLVVRTPFSLKGSTDSSIYRISSLNGVEIDDLTDTVYIDEKTSKQEMPLTVGLGAAYNVSENLLLSVDLEYRNFADKVVKNLDSVLLTAGGERNEYYTDRNPYWKDVWQYRLGAEYLIHTPIGIIPLRCGFRNEEFPGGNITSYIIRYEGAKGSLTNDSSRISYILDSYNKGLERFHRVTGYSLAGGVGIHWAQIQLDFAYTYTTYKQDIYASLDAGVKSSNRWKNHHINFTFTGYF